MGRRDLLPLFSVESAEEGDEVLRGKLDAIIVALPHEERGVLRRPLSEEPFKAVVPVTHPWARKKRIDRDTLAREKVILPHAGHCFRRQVPNQCPGDQQV